MRRLKLAGAVAAYCAVAVLLSRSSLQPWLRALVVLPLAIVLPGWLSLRALAPRRTFPRLELGIYAVSMSLSICALGGIAMQLVFGLDGWVWLVFLVGLALSLAAVGSSLGRFDIEAPRPHLPPGFFATVSAIVLAVVISAGSIALVTSGAAAQRDRAQFAELWIVPARADGHPAAEVGVGNREGVRAAFEVRVERAGLPVLDESVSLQNGGTWSRVIRLGREAEPVRALLLRDGKVLRIVWLRGGAAS